MLKRLAVFAPFALLIKWFFLASIVGMLAGSASAFFLFALEWATVTRLANPLLLAGLPLAGFAVGWIYLRFGTSVEAGNNLLIDEINEPQKIIPLRMAPLVLGGTVVSHLFGASVGREGTAVQMGAALADQLTRVFDLKNGDRRVLLMAGIAAGFASVFGTPLAGAIFGLEVMAIGRMRVDAIWPCLIAAVIADQVGLLWGVQHTHYAIARIPAISLWGLAAVLLAGAIFGLTARCFANTTHWLAARLKKVIHYPPLRLFIGGVLIAAVAYALSAERYLGLGVPTIVESFQYPMAHYDFAAKFAFTVASLASGFKGGEVTPLFYIGATLGNVLAPWLNLPFAFLAGLGFVAVFAGAANTPIASTLMAIEMFGAEIGVYAALACVISYLCSGHTGIYRSQRVVYGKHQALPEGIKLSEIAAYYASKKTKS
ncbi:MAG: hypothetical protein RL571_1022 [Pseudomonadota bacterium]